MAVNIMNQLRQGWLIQPVQHVGQLGVSGTVDGEMDAIDLAQVRNQRVAMFPSNLAVLVAVALIEAGLFHLLSSWRANVARRSQLHPTRLSVPLVDVVALSRRMNVGRASSGAAESLRSAPRAAAARGGNEIGAINSKRHANATPRVVFDFHQPEIGNPMYFAFTLIVLPLLALAADHYLFSRGSSHSTATHR
jgi:hypothetical protein